MTDLLTADEAAKYLRVSKSKMLNLLYKGVIPSVKLGEHKGSRRLIRKSDLEVYIDSMTVQGR